jgi:leader peptidase (prepilin peptidase)/N-methyltransferase
VGEDQLRAAATLEAGAFAFLAVASVWLAVVDARTSRLPNGIVLPTYGVGAVLLSASALLAGTPARIGAAAIGMALLLATYGALRVASAGGMGAGDVKLAGALGLYLGHLGTGPLVVGTVGGFVLGGVIASALLVTGHARASSSLPFGPWMLAGAWVGVVAGDPIWHALLPR